MNWYFDVLKKYAVFRGRARRKEYWYFFLINIVISLVLALVDKSVGSFNPQDGMGLIGGIYSLAVLLPGIAVTVRRLHDINRTGWWVLISLIPIIGLLVLFFFVVQDSTPGENRYGAYPK